MKTPRERSKWLAVDTMLDKSTSREIGSIRSAIINITLEHHAEKLKKHLEENPQEFPPLQEGEVLVLRSELKLIPYNLDLTL